jgi:hypothetical protein
MRGTHLTSQVFDLNCTALKCHDQARLELILGTTELLCGEGAVQKQTKLVHEVREDLRRRISGVLLTSRRVERGEEAEERRIGVDVVEGGTVVDLWVVVEDVRVQPGVHALSGTAYVKLFQGQSYSSEIEYITDLPRKSHLHQGGSASLPMRRCHHHECQHLRMQGRHD